jgi:broad specificity phosphatase PhoE
MDRFEELEHRLDPHRDEERARAVAEVSDRLRRRGIAVTGTERPEDLADLLSAVERFEAAAEAHGGDPIVDEPRSTEPDDVHFVIPRRPHGESTRDYIERVERAADALRRHPRHPD